MLKKMAMLLALTLFAGSAYATATLNQFGSETSLPGFKQSKSVDVAYESAGTPPDRYSISSKHKDGNTYYGTLSGSTSIFRSTQDAKVGTALTANDNPTVPTSPTDSNVTGGIGGWTAM